MSKTADSRKEAARKEIAQREMARRHILPFIMRFKKNYEVGWVHKVFARKVEQFYHDVKAGRQPRLMIFVPPRHGKSEIISRSFPAWALGQDPTLQIIMSAYSLDLPREFSKVNRERMMDPAYKTLFPDTALDPNSTNAEHWKTTAKGEVKAAGVGGGLGGFGADIFIIDDPIKDFQDAQSETIRETVKNWYTSVADNRLSPNSGVILVLTRWHDDDLAGWRLRTAQELRSEGIPDSEIEQWNVVSFPAIAEADEYIDTDYKLFHEPLPGRVRVRKEGEALHPARYPINVLNRKRHAMPSQQWSALFQQNPVPDSGEFFTKDDFVFYDSTPVLHDYPVLFAWDLAVGEKKTNDWTVGLAAAVIPQDGINTLWILDMFRRRVRDKELYEAVLSMYLKYKHNASRIGMEYGQLFLSVERPILAEFRKKGITPVWDRDLRPVSDKRVRATPARGWMQHHRIKWPRHVNWVDTAMAELLRFDAGVNDDIVDALAWLVRMAEKMHVVEKKTHRPGYKTVDEQIRDYYRQQEAGSGSGFMSA